MFKADILFLGILQEMSDIMWPLEVIYFITQFRVIIFYNSGVL